jgi:hypothetical protein
MYQPWDEDDAAEIIKTKKQTKAIMAQSTWMKRERW